MLAGEAGVMLKLLAHYDQAVSIKEEPSAKIWRFLPGPGGSVCVESQKDDGSINNMALGCLRVEEIT